MKAIWKGHSMGMGMLVIIRGVNATPGITCPLQHQGQPAKGLLQAEPDSHLRASCAWNSAVAKALKDTSSANPGSSRPEPP